MAIVKSSGVTRTERLLADLCERTFLRLWSYPNPFKEDGKELCDLLVVFGDDVFIFFDRESRRFDGADKNILVEWDRWKKEAVDKQINTARGAERYIRSGRCIYLDNKREVAFPITIKPDATIHRFVVAHGARDACKAFSDANVYGSLGIWYGELPDRDPWPFMLSLDKSDITHVLDSHNVGILFNTLDTLHDFAAYIREKERAVTQYKCLAYCGEEDLLAHYLFNYDDETGRYRVGLRDGDYDSLFIGEGEWQSLETSELFRRRQTANKVSYFWDSLLQRTCQNALDGTIQGNADLLRGQSAIHEMAREPRLSRRALSQRMVKAIEQFPDTSANYMRNLSFMSSYFEGTGYVFLQVRAKHIEDYEGKYRPVRRTMLEVACGAARNKFPHLTKVIGIAIDAPKFTDRNSEDFILMGCADWPENLARHYREANKAFEFFETARARTGRTHFSEFPIAEERKRKIGRNEMCVCGSGKKYKKCCLKLDR